MITITTILSGRSGFEALKRNLVSLEPDWKIGVDILCVVTDKSLFVECRNFLNENVDKGECLVFYDKDATLKSVGEYLGSRNPLVFILAENVILPIGGLSKLYRNYLEYPDAGFVTGECKDYPVVRWVRDIYGAPQYIYSNEKTEYDLFTKIDVCPVLGILTKTHLYKELFCLDNLEGYGSYSYGIRLRRQGYQNYINTGVEYKHGGKK